MGMSPFEIVKSIVPTLSDKEKKEVVKLLTEDKKSPCEISGHKYKRMGQLQENWRSPPYFVSVCEKCGHEIKSGVK